MVCHGPLLHSAKAKVFNFAASTSLRFRAEMDANYAWDCTHLFCGAFGGWSQGLEWLPNSGVGFVVGRQVFVDIDEVTMNLCGIKHAMQIMSCPLRFDTPWNPTAKLGIVGSVADRSLPCVHRSQLNLMCTMSPPCQSWSKSEGLHDANGWSFIEAVQQVFVQQPALVFAECVDEFQSHPHYPLVQSVVHALGYKTLWTQIMPYHELSNHFRSRWLYVWIRADTPSEPLGFQLPCSIAPRIPWHDRCYQFHLPSVWQEQVRLSASEYILTRNSCQRPIEPR